MSKTPTLDDVHFQVLMPTIVTSAILMAIALAFVFGLYGKPYDTGDIHVEGGISEGQSGQAFAGIILGAGIGGTLGYWVIAPYVVAPAWWWLRYAKKW